MTKLYKVTTVSTYVNTYMVRADDKAQAKRALKHENFYENEPIATKFVNESVADFERVTEQWFEEKMEKESKKGAGKADWQFWVGDRLVVNADEYDEVEQQAYNAFDTMVGDLNKYD